MTTRATIGTVLLGVLISSIVCVPIQALALETRLIAEFTFKPGQSAATFNVPREAESYPIVIRNGTAVGKDRVSSAVVTVNGRELFRQRDFNQNVGSLSATLPKNALQASGNEVVVRINGRPSAYLVVSISGVYPTPTLVRYYQDRDRDGYGAIGMVMTLPAGTLPPPPGPLGQSSFIWVNTGGDCNDSNPLVYPGRGCALLP